MSLLPPKPDAVAHVSDAHWEAALVMAANMQGDKFEDYAVVWQKRVVVELVDHARCLILLGEAKEPADPIEDGLKKAFHAWLTDKRYFDDGENAFNAACRKHFAGLTFPEVQP